MRGIDNMAERRGKARKPKERENLVMHSQNGTGRGTSYSKPLQMEERK